MKMYLSFDDNLITALMVAENVLYASGNFFFADDVKDFISQINYKKNKRKVGRIK